MKEKRKSQSFMRCTRKTDEREKQVNKLNTQNKQVHGIRDLFSVRCSALCPIASCSGFSFDPKMFFLKEYIHNTCICTSINRFKSLCGGSVDVCLSLVSKYLIILTWGGGGIKKRTGPADYSCLISPRLNQQTKRRQHLQTEVMFQT